MWLILLAMVLARDPLFVGRKHVMRPVGWQTICHVRAREDPDKPTTVGVPAYQRLAPWCLRQKLPCLWR